MPAAASPAMKVRVPHDPKGGIHDQRIPTRGPSSLSDQLCLHSCFVNKDKMFWLRCHRREAVSEPVFFALPPYLCAAALAASPHSVNRCTCQNETRLEPVRQHMLG